MTANFWNHILLDPIPPGAVPGGQPSDNIATVQLSKTALDETDHNKAPEEPAGGDNTFDINDITTDRRPTQNDKLPSNQVSKNATRTKQVFKLEEPPTKPTEEEDPNAEPPKEKEPGEKKEIKDEPDKTKKPETEGAETNEEVEEKIGKDNENAEEGGTTLPRNRNYDGLDADDVKILKGSNNYHYKKFRPLLDKWVARAKEGETYKGKVEELNKVLEGKGIPPNYYSHPQAFTLTPQFTQLQDKYDRLTAEREFYEAQLVNVKSGKPFVKIAGYDKNTGQPQLTPAREGTHADDVEISNLIQRYIAAESGIQNEVAGMQATFKQTYESQTAAIHSVIDKNIEQLIPELRPAKEEMETFLGAIPPAFKDDPMAKAASKMYGVILRQAKLLGEYRAKEKNVKKIAADNEEAGPNTKNLPRNGTAGANKPNGSGKTVRLPNGKVVPAVFDINELAGDND